MQKAQASGKLVIEAEAIAKSFGERPIVRDFSIRIERGDRIGIVGPNGAGKTTLLNLLTGALAPDSRHGASSAPISRSRRSTSAARASTRRRRVADTLTGGRGDSVDHRRPARHVIGYMKDFLFRPEQARTPVKALSGGERGRLMLARALAQPSNLLVLDEPTNDLDLETLDLLQEMLADYPGTLLLVSHDRDFLDRVATSMLVAEGRRALDEYAGGYSDMVAQRGSGVGRARPSRSKAPRRPRRPRPAPRPRQREAAALLQGPARAEDAAGPHRGARGGDRARWRRRCPIRTSTAATRRNSPRPAQALAEARAEVAAHGRGMAPDRVPPRGVRAERRRRVGR